MLLQLWKVLSCGQIWKFSKQFNVGKLQATCSIGNCKAGSYIGPPGGTPRLELRFRKRDEGFEGILWVFALEYDQQIGQESGSNIYISRSNRKKYRYIKLNLLKRGGPVNFLDAAS